MNFFIISDEKYAHTLLFGVKNILKIYPQANIYIYDWGLNKNTIAQLNSLSSQVSVIHWEYSKGNIKGDIDFYKIIFNLLARSFLLISFASLVEFLKSLKRIFLSLKKLHSRAEFEFILDQKVACLKHCVMYHAYGKELIALDADAVVIDALDGVFSEDMDFGITIRPEKEIKKSKKDMQLINVGVLFIGKKSSRMIAFLEEWEEQTKKTFSYCREQTALSDILLKSSPGFYQNNEFCYNSLNSIKIKILPCEIYNFNWIEEVVKDKEKLSGIKILHFKGDRHSPDNFKELVNELGLSE